jgi:hypothetical protein
MWQKIKCFFGGHTWIIFLFKEGKQCVFCKKEVGVKELNWSKSVSLTGFDALRKEYKCGKK